MIAAEMPTLTRNAGLMEGFRRERVRTQGAEIHVAIGGDGPPLLLLHGNPLTHVSWHKIAPALAKSFTVVAGDLETLETEPIHQLEIVLAHGAEGIGRMIRAAVGL